MLPLLLLPYLSGGLSSELDDWLARGEVSVFELKDDGHLKQVTNITDLPAPVDAVWAKLIDFEAWPTWMTQVDEVQVVARDGDALDVRWNIAVVGPAVTFTGRYTLDTAKRTITGEWLDGQLKGSFWSWRLEPHGAQTRLYRTSFTNAVTDNWLLRQLDDEAHTMEYGINAATGFLEVRALKRALGGV